MHCEIGVIEVVCKGSIALAVRLTVYFLSWLAPLLQEIWGAAYIQSTSDSELVLACYSEEPSSDVHPTEATWLCE